MVFALKSRREDWQSFVVRGKIKMDNYMCREGGIKVYIAICDDQVSELENLINLLHIWQEEHHTTLRYKTFRNAAELLNAAETEGFTLYLLDVMMPVTDGMAAAREIRSFNETVDIVFLTSSPDFAYASYGVHALDYLLKPIQPEMLFPILSRLSLREQALPDDLLLKSGATLIRVPVSQLTYVEVMNKHLYFNLNDGTVREVSGTLKQCESLLHSHPEFKQIHRSYIVNMRQIVELSPNAVKTVSGKNLPVSRSLYPNLQKDYVKLLFDQRER